MKDAYSVIEDLASCSDNIKRQDYCKELIYDLSKEMGYEMKVFDINHSSILPFRGNQNIVLESGAKNPILLTAHYDAVFKDLSISYDTVPAANDNSSGVGCVTEIIQNLNGLPVDLALFGAEEYYINCGNEELLEGSYSYTLGFDSGQTKVPRAVINLDSCGVGDKIKIPSQNLVWNERLPVDPRLHSVLTDSFLENSVKCVFGSYSTLSDHVSFHKSNIPACAVIGDSNWYFGMGAFRGNKIYHTEKDVPQIINQDLLRSVVDSVSVACKRIGLEGKL